MINFTQLTRYKMKAGSANISNREFLNLMDSSIYQEPHKLVMSSYGWDKIFQSQIISNALSHDFVVGVFKGALRSAPQQLVDRHVNSAIESRKLAGEKITKEIKAAIAHDVRSELDMEVIPAGFKCATFFIEASQELWMLSASKECNDMLQGGLMHIMRNAGYDFLLIKTPISDGYIRELMTSGIPGFDIEISLAKFKNDAKTINVFKATDTEFRDSIIRNYGNKFISAVFGSKDSSVEIHIKGNGITQSVKALDGFRQSWYENGDPESPEFLTNISCSLWVREVESLFNTIRLSSEQYHNAKDYTNESAVG